MSSKHLYIEHADVPHAAAIWPLTDGRRGHLYGTNGTCEKLSNLMCLTRCGFYDHLEEGGLVYLNMSMWCRAHGTYNFHFSNCRSSRTKPEKLQRSLAFAMLLFETKLMELYGRSHPAHKACKDGLPYGSRTLWVSRGEGIQEFLTRSWLERSQTSKVLKSFKGPRSSSFQWLKGFRV